MTLANGSGMATTGGKASASRAGWGLKICATPREASQLPYRHDSKNRRHCGAIVARIRHCFVDRNDYHFRQSMLIVQQLDRSKLWPIRPQNRRNPPSGCLKNFGVQYHGANTRSDSEPSRSQSVLKPRQRRPGCGTTVYSRRSACRTRGHARFRGLETSHSRLPAWRHSG